MLRVDKSHFSQKFIFPLLLLILISGLTLRVWNVNFDRGMGSHPDERSTTSNYAVSIHLPDSWEQFWDPQRSPLNPLWSIERQERRSYTYGHFPLYLGVAFGELLHTLAPVAERIGLPAAATTTMARANDDWTAIAVAGRLTIALLDTWTILLLFCLGRRIFSPAAGLLAAAFYAYAAQAVQLSHFFAMDPASTTFTVLTVLGAVTMVQERTWRAALLTGIGAGLAIASKFSALPILLTPFAAAFVIWLDAQCRQQAEEPVDGRALFAGLVGAPLAVIVAAVVFFLTSPYAVLDWKNFLLATLVEQGRMVRGIADFPFTRQYRNTTPYLYFIEQQVRWGLWWPLGVVAVLGTLHALMTLLGTLFHLFTIWLRRTLGRAPQLSLSDASLYNLVIWSWVLPYFGITGAFLAKFNRYMSPVLPFVLLFAAGLIWRLWSGKRETGNGKRETGYGIRDAGNGIDETENGVEETENGIEEAEYKLSDTHYATRTTLVPVERSSRRTAGLIFGRTLAALLTLIGIGGGLFWSVAYVNGVYAHDHTWITASRWMAQNIQPGEVILCEQWDDCLPPGSLDDPIVNDFRAGMVRIDWGPYENDTLEKYAIMKDVLRQADYVAYSSKRIYDSVDELPARYPMTIRYYEAMWSGELGFEVAADISSPPRLFGFVFDDRAADESWSLYDHSRTTIFRKVRDLSDAEFDALFAGTWETAIPGDVGESSALSPLFGWLGLGSNPESADRGLLNRLLALVMGDETAPTPQTDVGERKSLFLDQALAELPVVDNYRWNQAASTNVPLAIFWWWLVLALLGWAAWPFAFVLCKPLRDRGYLLARMLGWLLGGWLLWWLASIGLALNTVANAWLTVGVLAIFGLFVAIRQGAEIRAYLRTHWPLILAGEALFALAYLFFVLIRMANPDIWQPWFGGEKFMEFAFLTGILRSPTFPPVDPHFAGGYINYYYFGLYLVAYLIKLTGIYAEVAFNLAIPSLFALTVVNTFSIAYSAQRFFIRRAPQSEPAPLPEPDALEVMADDMPHPAPATESPMAPPAWYRGFGTALLAPLFVVLIGNLDGFAQVARNLANLSSSSFQSAFGLVQTLVQAGYGVRAVLAGQQTLPSYDFWGPSRVIPATINEFPYWSFLFADLHPHLIGIPLAALFLALVFVLLSDYADAGGVIVWRRAWGRGLALLATFALLLGALASVNLWELPTYFGLGVLALIVSQYRGYGKINWVFTLAVTAAYGAGAYLTFRPFFQNYVNIGASGVGLVQTGDELGTWLLIWGFLAFILLSWLLYSAAQPARGLTVAAVSAQPTGCERWLSLALRRFDRLPRVAYLHRLLVQPQVSYLVGLAILPLSLFASAGSLLWDRSVLALCLACLGLAVLLLWRRGRQADASGLLVALLTATGLAILAGTQVIFLKDFLQGGDWYRMNTLFKFFSQVWVIWGVAAAIAVPQIWKRQPITSVSAPEKGARRLRRNGWRIGWKIIFWLLLLPSLAYLLWGTPARLDQRLVGWRPPFGTLNGLDYMRQGAYSWPDGNNMIELAYDREAIDWLLDHVRGNALIVESSEVDYYRAGGTRVASLTGLSGMRGMHEGEQRYPEDLGPRDGLHGEFWSTTDVARTQQIMDEVGVALIYVGQLERFKHPEGVFKLEQMADAQLLTPIFQNERTIIYAVPDRLAQDEAGIYFPQ